MLKRRMKRASLAVVLLPLCILLTGFVLPQSFQMPVEGAGSSSFNPRSFWYYPWGRSVTHKGVDIFAKAGTPVHASVPGIVVYTGTLGRGGNVVLLLGPKWRFHYYAHLKTIDAKRGEMVGHDDVIGTVGNTGNAAGKPSHLHYAIATLIPYPWLADAGPHGLYRMWYLDPTPLLAASR
jgi:murein DD-endopeptidase MepM/ murein hydrolase activator NlpD